jgi:hypothetical protein
MPSIIQGNTESQNLSELNSADLGYEYPNGTNLRPGSEQHQRLLTDILRRARESHGFVSNRFSSWNDIDEILNTYIYTDEAEKKVRLKDPRKPVSIVFPYSFAILETLVSYMVAAFLDEPVFRYEGVSPEDTLGAILLEKVVNLQCNKSKIGLALHTMFRDSLVYGVGPVSVRWSTKYGFRTVNINGFKAAVDSLLYEGNKIQNIDPYTLLPDPNVPIDRVQDGEFFGWVEKTTYQDLLRREKNGDDPIFNVGYLKYVLNEGSQFAGDHDRRTQKTTKNATVVDEGVVKKVHVLWMYADIIPKDYGIGDSEYPEKWLFAVGNDKVVLAASPINLDHDMYPVAVAAPDYDGYTTLPLSRMEVMLGMQEVLDWLFNSHIANVRKAINDMIIYDPYLLNAKDMEEPGPGKLVRTRRPAWGKGVRDAAMQLEVRDITQAHIADSAFVVNWMQKIAAADDPMMGSLRQSGPERLTKAEFQGTRAGATGRLERMARMIGMQAMQDIGYMMASHTQQLMSQETFVNISGRWQEVLIKDYEKLIQQGKMKVSPMDLLIDYDVMVRDGSVPGNNFSESWIQLFQTLTQSPELAQGFDIQRIFQYIARNLGAKNVDGFTKVQPVVMPDEQVQEQVQRGNMAPVEEVI